MDYREFLGYSEDDLGLGSTGNEVLDLQHRLLDLGYFGEEPDGAYDITTISAVKRLQKDMGLTQNGITTDSMLEIIYSEEAPVSDGVVTLTEGRSGPVVKKLQTALKELAIYNDSIDSIYDLGVSQAIEKFQLLCGYDVDGVASAEVQQCVYYLLDEIEQVFGEGNIPEPELVTEEITVGIVDAEVKVKIREYMDTESREIGKVSPGDKVIILDSESDDKWCQIASGSTIGYMYQKYLKTSTEENQIVRFSDGSKSYTIGTTLEERLNGDETIADEFGEYYASEQFISSAEEPVDYVTVNTGSDDVRLNLRADASSEAEILAEVPNATDLRVISNDGTWTRVAYGEDIGYLMNQYLSFWQDSPDALEEESEYVDSDELDTTAVEEPSAATAVAVCPDGASEAAKRAYAVLTAEPQPVDALAAAAQMPIPMLLAALTELEMFGCATNSAGQQYKRS